MGSDKPASILLVSGDLLRRTALAALLRQYHCQVSEWNPRVDFVPEQSPPLFDMVILDQEALKPQVTETLCRWKQEGRCMTFVRLHRVGSDEEAVWDARLRICDQLVEPWTPEDLMYLLERWQNIHSHLRESLQADSAPLKHTM